jgi:hypothetical protein
MSVCRHTENCLKSEIGSIIREHKYARAIDVHQEFEDNLAFAKDLRAAAREYLADPIDPLKLKLIPRADEIDVTYFDNTDFTAGQNPVPKKKTAKLSALLHDIEQIRNLEVDKINIKHVDIRSFALDAIKTADTCIDKFAKLSGAYQEPRDNEQSLQKVLQSFALWVEKNPNASNVERGDAIERFARGGGVPVNVLAEKAGVQLIEQVQ